jgi:hypothetical protein
MLDAAVGHALARVRVVEAPASSTHRRRSTAPAHSHSHSKTSVQTRFLSATRGSPVPGSSAIRRADRPARTPGPRAAAWRDLALHASVARHLQHAGWLRPSAIDDSVPTGVRSRRAAAPRRAPVFASDRMHANALEPSHSTMRFLRRCRDHEVAACGAKALHRCAGRTGTACAPATRRYLREATRPFAVEAQLRSAAPASQDCQCPPGRRAMKAGIGEAAGPSRSGFSRQRAPSASIREGTMVVPVGDQQASRRSSCRAHFGSETGARAPRTAAPQRPRGGSRRHRFVGNRSPARHFARPRSRTMAAAVREAPAGSQGSRPGARAFPRGLRSHLALASVESPRDRRSPTAGR